MFVKCIFTAGAPYRRGQKVLSPVFTICKPHNGANYSVSQSLWSHAPTRQVIKNWQPYAEMSVRVWFIGYFAKSVRLP